MKKTRLITTLLLLVAAVCSAVPDKKPQEEYIEKYSDIAISEMHRTGVPASITLAQGLLESGAGRSKLAVKGNNHFGIKCHGWKGRTMKLDDDAPNECFRVYKNAEQSFRDHSDFLRYRDRYQFLFDYEITDYKSWAYGLKKAGYATDPSYPTKLINIVETWDLTRFDRGVAIPESPAVLEMPTRVESDFEFKEQITFDLSKTIYVKNNVEFVYSRLGDTYEGIAHAHGLFTHEILRFNELDEEVELLPGTVVFIQPKRNKAAKGIDQHIVGTEPENLYDICQRYAVKMSAVRRRNKLSADYVPSDGDVIYLR